MRKLILAAAMTTILAGCSSTDNSLPMVNGEFVYPSMPILSDSPYVWDNNKSEALNIVEMAKPAGIGNSLQDHADGTNATIGHIGAGSGLFDAALGLATGGIVGALQEESTRTGANKLTLFNPTIVDVVERDKVSINGSPNYELVRNYLAEKIKKAIDANHTGVDWGGAYSIYNGKKKNDLVLIVNDEKTCKKASQVAFADKDADAFMTRKFSDIFIDGEAAVRNYCAMLFYISTPVTTTSNKVVLTAEAKSAPYFVNAIIENYDGYVVVPDYYKMGKVTVKNEYAYVSKKGQRLFFQTP